MNGWAGTGPCGSSGWTPCTPRWPEENANEGAADDQQRTDPRRLARWIGDIEGDLRPGGQFRAHFFTSGWEGTGRVEACEPPHRWLVRTKDTDDPDEHAIEATLTADGDHTILVIEERGIPLDQLAAYGAGVQVHVEDLAAHIAGRERGDTQQRWTELLPTYQALAASVG